MNQDPPKIDAGLSAAQPREKNIGEVTKGENPSFIYDPSGYFTRIRPDPNVRRGRPHFVIIPDRQTIALPRCYRGFFPAG